MDVSGLNTRSKGRLPGLIGIEIVESANEKLVSKLDIRDELLAPNGYLHAASVIALADTTCGYGCVLNFKPDVASFTTVELKANFIGTARKGTIFCHAERIHSGKTTEVWDARVSDAESGKLIALFRCTQMLLYRKEKEEVKN
ncbi:MAG: PaaI family thioesterase [Candidatus Obscuribacterales bacterium]|jgi:uncharacterized protein (TIGR00369 family)|nr:PaaI family thioesterase [Candidatus Obscuribacterales bacterium]